MTMMGMGLAGMGFETAATRWAGGALTKRFESAGGDGGTSIHNRSTDAGGGSSATTSARSPDRKRTA